jgi:hypothetical protein
VAGADAGQSGPHDEDVEVGRPLGRRLLHQVAAPINLSFVAFSPTTFDLQDSTDSVVSVALIAPGLRG